MEKKSIFWPIWTFGQYILLSRGAGQNQAVRWKVEVKSFHFCRLRPPNSSWSLRNPRWRPETCYFTYENDYFLCDVKIMDISTIFQWSLHANEDSSSVRTSWKAGGGKNESSRPLLSNPPLGLFQLLFKQKYIDQTCRLTEKYFFFVTFKHHLSL